MEIKIDSLENEPTNEPNNNTGFKVLLKTLCNEQFKDSFLEKANISEQTFNTLLGEAQKVFDISASASDINKQCTITNKYNSNKNLTLNDLKKIFLDVSVYIDHTEGGKGYISDTTKELSKSFILIDKFIQNSLKEKIKNIKHDLNTETHFEICKEAANKFGSRLGSIGITLIIGYGAYVIGSGILANVECADSETPSEIPCYQKLAESDNYYFSNIRTAAGLLLVQAGLDPLVDGIALTSIFAVTNAIFSFLTHTSGYPFRGPLGKLLSNKTGETQPLLGNKNQAFSNLTISDNFRNSLDICNRLFNAANLSDLPKGNAPTYSSLFYANNIFNPCSLGMNYLSDKFKSAKVNTAYHKSLKQFEKISLSLNLIKINNNSSNLVLTRGEAQSLRDIIEILSAFEENQKIKLAEEEFCPSELLESIRKATVNKSVLLGLKPSNEAKALKKSLEFYYYNFSTWDYLKKLIPFDLVFKCAIAGTALYLVGNIFPSVREGTKAVSNGFEAVLHIIAEPVEKILSEAAGGLPDGETLEEMGNCTATVFNLTFMAKAANNLLFNKQHSSTANLVQCVDNIAFIPIAALFILHKSITKDLPNACKNMFFNELYIMISSGYNAAKENLPKLPNTLVQKAGAAIFNLFVPEPNMIFDADPSTYVQNANVNSNKKFVYTEI